MMMMTKTKTKIKRIKNFFSEKLSHKKMSHMQLVVRIKKEVITHIASA